MWHITEVRRRANEAYNTCFKSLCLYFELCCTWLVYIIASERALKYVLYCCMEPHFTFAFCTACTWCYLHRNRLYHVYETYSNSGAAMIQRLGDGLPPQQTLIWCLWVTGGSQNCFYASEKSQFACGHVQTPEERHFIKMLKGLPCECCCIPACSDDLTYSTVCWVPFIFSCLRVFVLRSDFLKSFSCKHISICQWCTIVVWNFGWNSAREIVELNADNCRWCVFVDLVLS